MSSEYLPRGSLEHVPVTDDFHPHAPSSLRFGSSVDALHDEGVKNVLVTVVAKLGKLEPDAFWFVMDNRNWMHPFDDQGRRRPYKDLPRSVTDLVDDPFRSLAGELRRAGGFAKDTTPFSEFLWADFFRRRIKRTLVENDFERAGETALQLARGGEADFLPGWCGPVPTE